jgi:hypothetical protein
MNLWIPPRSRHDTGCTTESGSCLSDATSSINQIPLPPSPFSKGGTVLARGTVFSTNDCEAESSVEFDNDEDIMRDMDDFESEIGLAKKFPGSTREECRRFLNTRPMTEGYNREKRENRVGEKIKLYLKWRSKYQLGDVKQHGKLRKKLDFSDGKERDIVFFEHAISHTASVFNFSKSETDSDADKSDERFNNLTKILPRFIRMIDGRKGERILYIFTAMIDAKIAPLQFYALLVAVYLDLHMDRNSTESILTVLDVRKGSGWSNPAPTTMFPFLKGAVKHLEHHPGRMSCLHLYSIPYPAKFIWNLSKGFLKESMVRRICLHWGNLAVESQMPESLNSIFDEEELISFEKMRVSEFRSL